MLRTTANIGNIGNIGHSSHTRPPDSGRAEAAVRTRGGQTRRNRQSPTMAPMKPMATPMISTSNAMRVAFAVVT
jgi:hypothetical protein